VCRLGAGKESLIGCFPVKGGTRLSGVPLDHCLGVDVVTPQVLLRVSTQHPHPLPIITCGLVKSKMTKT
jgi:hypothetical protein